MVKVDISDLESDAKESLVDFIESKLPLKSDTDGGVVTFTDKSPRSHVTSPEVRTYLKRYLHAKDLKKQYRILSEDNSLKFVKQKVDKKEEEEEAKEKESE